MQRWALLGGFALLVGLLVWFGSVWYSDTEQQITESLFEAEGNLIQGNPGFEPGVWHLSYEQPGAPGLSARLIFDDSSVCEREGVRVECDMTFSQGQRVRVVGTAAGGDVRVTHVYILSP